VASGEVPITELEKGIPRLWTSAVKTGNALFGLIVIKLETPATFEGQANPVTSGGGPRTEPEKDMPGM